MRVERARKTRLSAFSFCLGSRWTAAQETTATAEQTITSDHLHMHDTQINQ